MASIRKTYNEKTNGCRFGNQCYDVKCRFDHIEICRHDPNCSHSNCKFWHPLMNSQRERPTLREERPVRREERLPLRDNREERPTYREERQSQRKPLNETPNVIVVKLIEKQETEIEELKKKLKVQEKEITELKEENAKLKDENAKLKLSGMQQPVKRGLFS